MTFDRTRPENRGPMHPHRRDFLRSSLSASTLVAMGASTGPSFLGRSARAAAGSNSNDRVLVVVQLIGGNDGLNTVVPHGLEGYTRARRALRLPAGQGDEVTNEIGLPPARGQMAKLLEDGHLAIVQGVGYPNPDRSHFRSMEIWETARLEYGALETGWLRRALGPPPPGVGLDNPGAPDIPGLHIGGRSLPLALKSKKTEVPSLTTLEQYRLQIGGDVAAKRE